MKVAPLYLAFRGVTMGYVSVERPPHPAGERSARLGRLSFTEQGCKWRGLPKLFGRWHTVYMRMNRWSKADVLDRVFEKLQVEQIVRISVAQPPTKTISW